MDPTEDDIRLESRFGVNKPFTQKQKSKIRSMVSRHLTGQIDDCLTSQQSKVFNNNKARIVTTIVKLRPAQRFELKKWFKITKSCCRWELELRTQVYHGLCRRSFQRRWAKTILSIARRSQTHQRYCQQILLIRWALLSRSHIRIRIREWRHRTIQWRFRTRNWEWKILGKSSLSWDYQG